jgi:schlafen family protein
LFLPPVVARIVGTRSIDDLGYTELKRLVGCDESEWLDAKGGPPERNADGGKRVWRAIHEGLAEDVVAFANRDGGLVVIGASEENGVINAVLGVDLPMGELEQAIQHSLFNRVRPIPDLAIKVLRPIELDGAGVVLVLVDAGSEPPYSVELGGSHTYLRRERRGNRRLTEAEIARLYWRRFERQQQVAQELDHLDSELQAVSDELIPAATFAGHIAVVGIGAVPQTPCRWRPNRDNLDQLLIGVASRSDEAVGQEYQAIDWVARPTRRGLRVSTRGSEGRPRSSRMLMGFDGTSRFSWGIRSDAPLVREDSLAAVVAVGLGTCLLHAIRSGARSELYVTARLDVPDRGLVPLINGDPTRVIVRDETPVRIRVALRDVWGSASECAAMAEELYQDLLIQAMEFAASDGAIERIRQVIDAIRLETDEPYSGSGFDSIAPSIGQSQ